MLNDFSWNMTGYIPKYQVNPHGDGIISYVAERIFQLEPEPPAVDSLNEYILSALQEKNLLYFSFFLHHYEPQLNKRIKDFLGVDMILPRVRSMLHTSIRSSGILCSVSAWAKKNGRYPL